MSKEKEQEHNAEEAGSSGQSRRTRDRTKLEKGGENVSRTNGHHGHHLKKKSHDGSASVGHTKIRRCCSTKNKKSSIPKESTLDKKTPDRAKSERTTSKIREGRSRSRSRGASQRKLASKRSNTKQATQDDFSPHQEEAAGSPKALSMAIAAGELLDSPTLNVKDMDQQQQITGIQRTKSRSQRGQRVRTRLRRSNSFSAVKARRQPPRKMVSSSDLQFSKKNDRSRMSSSDLQSSKKSDRSRSMMKDNQTCQSPKRRNERIRRTKTLPSSRPREKKQTTASTSLLDESATESTRTRHRRGKKVSDGRSPRSTFMRDQSVQPGCLMDQLFKIDQLSIQSESDIEIDNEVRPDKFLQFDPTQDDNISILDPENISICDEKIVDSYRMGLLGALPGDCDEEDDDEIKIINWKKSEDISDIHNELSSRSTAGLVKKFLIRRWGAIRPST